jgi:oligopeptide/dipeptide ABC transporter ATP-binding protein
VEVASVADMFAKPRHPYTEALLSAVPRLDQPARERIVLRGDVPSPINPPPGCTFHPRCPYAQERCKIEIPSLRELDPGRFVACHYPVGEGH